MGEKRKYDEQRELPSPWEWVIITLFSAGIVGFGLLVYSIILEGPRHWDFGQLPDTPAESIYSTEAPRIHEKPLRQQIHKLPEALPLPEAKPRQEQQRERSPNR